MIYNFSKFLYKMETVLCQFGLDFRRLLLTLVALPRFIREARAYSKLAKDSAFPFRLENLRPMLMDRFASAGNLTPIYLYQDIWAARKIFLQQPQRHVDVGSSVQGFVAHVLSFMSVEVIDIRPLPISISGLKFVQEDATSLERLTDNSVESISSLHAVEHFGLGRYGDDISTNAYCVALRSLARVLSPGGVLYFSVPIGKERVQFNSQRIFNPLSIIQIVNDLDLLSFAVVDDDGRFLENVNPAEYGQLSCGCGMFEFTKRRTDIVAHSAPTPASL